MSERKTGLVVLYNHNYEKNIEKIRRIYKERFPEMRQLMPFYYGNDPEVIRVFDNSFYFQTYIAQAFDKLMEMDCDDFLIIGDDLLLNPALNATNLHEKLGMEEGEFYLDGIVPVSPGDHIRAVEEAQRFSSWPPGLDSSAFRIVPSYDEAKEILQGRGALESVSLSRHAPLYLKWRSPFWSNLRTNCGYVKSNVFQFLLSLSYRLAPRKMAYPCVFGYSDILVVPKSRMRELCNYLEVFGAWRMFVELAIPTAIMLLKDSRVKFADTTGFKPGNVWYPSNMEHYNRVKSLISQMVAKAQGQISRLPEAFPEEYLYLHPVKLSQLE